MIYYKSSGMDWLAILPRTRYSVAEMQGFEEPCDDEQGLDQEACCSLPDCLRCRLVAGVCTFHVGGCETGLGA